MVEQHSEENSWRDACEGARVRLAYVLQQQLWADCSFAVGAPGDVRVFSVHRVLLAAASPVFEAMLMRPLSPGADDSIEVLDVDPRAFHVMLQYIYTDDVLLDDYSLAASVYHVADKYQLPHLVKICSEHLTANLTAENAITAFETAKLFDFTELKDASLELFASATAMVLESADFPSAQLSTVSELFALELLQLHSEMQLFRAAQRWADAREAVGKEESEDTSSSSERNSKKEDGDGCDASKRPADPQGSRTLTSDKEDCTIRTAVRKIRFLTLTPREFAEGVENSLLMSEEEAYAIFMNISHKDSITPMPEGFSTDRTLRTTKKPVLTFRVAISGVSGMARDSWVMANPFVLDDATWQVGISFSNTPEDTEEYLDLLLCWVKRHDGRPKAYSCRAELELRVISSEPRNTVTWKRVITFKCRMYENMVIADRVLRRPSLQSPQRGFLINNCLSVEMCLLRDVTYK